MKKTILCSLVGGIFGMVAMNAFAGGCGSSSCTVFTLNNSTGQQINSTCNPANHYTNCGGGNQYVIQNVINTLSSTVTMYDANHNELCVVNMYESQDGAHGGTYYYAKIVGVTSMNPSYSCVQTGQSSVALANK